MDPFKSCPVYETRQFLIRKLERSDTDSLFACYSDPAAAKLFNGDCCGDDFYYTELSAFRVCVDYWLSRYEVKDFVRMSIQDKSKRQLIGTVEICPSLKYAVDGKLIGILRIDLKSEYEQKENLDEIMEILLRHVFEDYKVSSVIMKIPENALARKPLIKQYYFVPAKEECNITFDDYYICYRPVV